MIQGIYPEIRSNYFRNSLCKFLFLAYSEFHFSAYSIQKISQQDNNRFNKRLQPRRQLTHRQRLTYFSFYINNPSNKNQQKRLHGYVPLIDFDFSWYYFLPYECFFRAKGIWWMANAKHGLSATGLTYRFQVKNSTCVISYHGSRFISTVKTIAL